MSNNACVPLGCSKTFPLDSQQTLKKTYDKDVNAHRTLEVSKPWNKVAYEYNDNGQIIKATFTLDKDSEVTEIQANDDVSSSLNAKSFIIFCRNTLQYRFIYNVCGTATIPSNSNSIIYIGVNIKENDPAPVIALATKQAFLNSKMSESYTLDLSTGSDKFTITRKTKGDVPDSLDIDTDFTIKTTQQGLIETVEILEYEYNSDGSIKCITNSSGENVLGISDLNNIFTLMGDGNIARVNDYGELRVHPSQEQICILSDIKRLLIQLNIHMSYMTELEHTIGDIG